MTRTQILRRLIRALSALRTWEREEEAFLADFIPFWSGELLKLPLGDDGRVDESAHRGMFKQWRADMRKLDPAVEFGYISKVVSQLLRVCTWDRDQTERWAKHDYHPEELSLQDAVNRACAIEEGQDEVLAIRRWEERARACASDVKDQRREVKEAYLRAVKVELAL